MNRLMLDFETLDVGECPVVLSMGAVVFNDVGLVASLSAKIDQLSCVSIGCTISQNTLDWWDQQSEEARKNAFGGTAEINNTMLKLVQLYEDFECCEIWSRGALADIRWVNSILEKLNIDKPWKYWQEMCFRTFLKMSPKVELEFLGTQHNALDDALHQVKLFHAIKSLQKNEVEA